MTIILGIDPGSRVTGYGVIKAEKDKRQYIASGCIRLATKQLGQKLSEIFTGIQEIVAHYQPDEFAIEQIFMHHNAQVAIKLGQARGAAIVAASSCDIPLTEYSAREIKQAVVGYGAAKKQQIQHMVCHILSLTKKPAVDAADALAIALCHANIRQSLLRGLRGG